MIEYGSGLKEGIANARLPTLHPTACCEHTKSVQQSSFQALSSTLSSNYYLLSLYLVLRLDSIKFPLERPRKFSKSPHRLTLPFTFDGDLSSAAANHVLGCVYVYVYFKCSERNCVKHSSPAQYAQWIALQTPLKRWHVLITSKLFVKLIPAIKQIFTANENISIRTSLARSVEALLSCIRWTVRW